MALPQSMFFFIFTLVLLSSFSVFANKDATPLSPAPAPHSPVHTPSPAPIRGHHHHHHDHHPPATAPAPAVKPPTHSSPPAAKPPTAPPPKPHHHHNHSPSAQPPLHAKPPTPTHTPVKPPSASPPLQKKPISVRGLVYCKSCNHLDNSSSPIMLAVVKLACNNTKYQLAEKSVTDKNGFFMITPKIVTSAGWHKCKVFLLSSPVLKCNVSTNFNLGIDGAPLNFTPPENKTLTHPLFTVGPFAFKPKKENC